MKETHSPWLDLRLADCMDLMREFPDKHFDLAIVDPPYGLGMATVSTDTPKNTNSQRKFYDSMSEKRWDEKMPCIRYFDELRRVSAHQIVWGGNYMADKIGATKCIIVWDKMTYIPTMSQFEFAFCSFNKHPKLVTINSTDVNRQHPTQKPVALYKWLLANYAKPGQRILDTHLGSGSHAIACHYAGVHLTACEIDPDYYGAAIERVNRETLQTDMFAPVVPEITEGELLLDNPPLMIYK